MERRLEEILGGDRYVHCLECDDGFTCMYIRQDSSIVRVMRFIISIMPQ